MTDVVEIGARAIRIALNRGVHFRDDTGEVAMRAALAALNEAGYAVVERGVIENLRAEASYWRRRVDVLRRRAVELTSDYE